MLVFSSCGVTTQTASNGGAAPTPTLAVAGGDPPLFVFMRGTYGAFQTVDDGVHWSQPGSFTLSGAIAHLTDAVSATTRWDAVSTTDDISSVVTSFGRSAWVVGHSLFTTRDAGATWAAVQHDAQLSGAGTLMMRSDTQAFARTENGTCASFKSNCSIQTTRLRTSDGGHTWTPLLTSGTPFK